MKTYDWFCVWTQKKREKLPNKWPGRMVPKDFGCLVASDNPISITYTLYLFLLCTYLNTGKRIKMDTIHPQIEEKWRSFSATENVMWKHAHHSAHKKF